MDDLSTKLAQLENDGYIAYVLARSEVLSDKSGYEGAGISRSGFYKWPKKDRDYLNKLARELKTETALKAKLILSDNTQKAAEVKVEGLNAKNEHVKQSAATEILDRMLGKPTQRREISGPKGKPVEIVEIVKNNGTLPTK